MQGCAAIESLTLNTKASCCTQAWLWLQKRTQKLMQKVISKKFIRIIKNMWKMTVREKVT